MLQKVILLFLLCVLQFPFYHSRYVLIDVLIDLTAAGRSVSQAVHPAIGRALDQALGLLLGLPSKTSRR